jgi:hypothetical protein
MPPTVSARAKNTPRSGGVSTRREQNVDDLTVLIDSPIEESPAAGHLDVGLVHEPPVTRRVPRRASGLDELRGEGLHPPVHGHVIHSDAALGKQLFDVAVGQVVTQVPAHRDRNHLTREPIPGQR